MPALSRKSQDSDYEEELKQEPEIRIARGTYAKLVFRRMFRLVGFLLLGLVVLYICFALTLVRIVPTLSTGLVPVKNVTYNGGILPQGAVVLADTKKEQGKSVIDRFKQSFIPSETAVKVKVAAGPYGKLSWASPGILTVDGKPIKHPFPADKDGKSPIDADNPYLKDQYVVVCVSGDCTPGEAIIVDSDKIYGSVLSTEGK